MRRFSRREIGFGLVFLLAGAWGAWNYRHLFSTTGAQQALTDARPASPATERTVVETGVDTVNAADSAAVAPASWGSDPFNRPWRMRGTPPPAAGIVFKKSALRLSAIVVRPPQRYAIINGTIVREGEAVAGRRVTRIEASRVLVDDNGVEVTLTL